MKHGLFGIEGGYKMIISGKPDSFEGIYEFIPIIFETTILLSAFGAVFGMIGLNGLPTLYHPLFTHDSFVEKAPTMVSSFVLNL